MNIKHLSIASLALATLALTACGTTDSPTSGSTPSADTGSAEQSATAFTSCLNDAGLEAKIAEGFVVVRIGVAFQDSEVAVESRSGGDSAVLMSYEDSEGKWVAPADSSYFAADAESQEAYAGCEADHPTFAQPDPSSMANSEEAKEAQAAMQASADAFAACAKEEGFTWVGDPVEGAIMIPLTVTEEEFRATLTACGGDGTALPGWMSDMDLPFNPSMVAMEFLS